MPSYLITGANRGMGFGFMRKLSQDPANTVIGIVRDKAAATKKAADEFGERSNLHFIEAQVTKHESLKSTVPLVSEITRGKLDYVISNAAGYGSDWADAGPIGKLAEEPERFEKDLSDVLALNLIPTIYLFALYLPLIRAGDVKKMIAISTGMADIDLISQFSIENGPIYAISKAAANAAVAKYDAQYRKEGILFLSISPGFVDTSNTTPTPEQLEVYAGMVKGFQAYAPDFTGPISVEESNAAVLSVIWNSSIEKGHGGAFISHKGNKQWL